MHERRDAAAGAAAALRDEPARAAGGARAKLARLREELQQAFVERSELIDGALAAVLASQHVLVIGPPGTAKSMLANELCCRFAGANYFQWLLTKFTTPEELFGAVSLRALEQDSYRRVTSRKLPEAHVAFLDEVFKASSSILNAILTLMNERVFHNGQEPVRVPLLSLFGASNELPEDEDLVALFDRFLLRFVVDYIAEDFRFLKMLQAVPPAERTVLTLEELGRMQAEAGALPVPAHIYRALADVRRELKKRSVVASDRRYRQSLGLLKALAYLRGRAVVSEADLLFLEHVLWRDPGERPDVRAVLCQLIYGYEDEVQELLYQTREINEYAARAWETEELRSHALIEAHTKIRKIVAKVEEIVEKARSLGRPLDKVDAARREIQQIQTRMLESF